MKITPARMAAFEILALVGAGKGHSDELLHSERTEALSPEDRNLATTLVMGVLRWQIALDARIRRLLERPEQRLADPVTIALRMGAFQLLHLDRVPAHAALSESVELCRAAGQPHATGMVNAVLRKIAAAQGPGKRIHESVAAFAERLAHPQWLVDRWVAHYGREAALAICEADQFEPVKGALFVPGNEDLPQIDDGSRLVAEVAAGAAPDAVKVWDCCAAPGGKTLLLAARLKKADVLATDISAKRLSITKTRLSRFSYGDRIKLAVADASQKSSGPERFDLILCDVPCTGTGTLARNPEIRHMLKVDQLPRQVERQRTILQAALERATLGGTVVYSTCSLEPEECEQVVDRVAAAAGASRVTVSPILAHLRASGILREDASLDGATPGEDLRTLPGIHGCDGFYAAVLRRNQ